MNFDPGSAAARYLPQRNTTTTITITLGGTSAWAQLNTTPAPRWFTFVNTAGCYIAQGPSNMAAPIETDFYMLAGERDFLILPGWGVRIYGNGAGFLSIAPTGV